MMHQRPIPATKKERTFHLVKGYIPHSGVRGVVLCSVKQHGRAKNDQGARAWPLSPGCSAIESYRVAALHLRRHTNT